MTSTKRSYQQVNIIVALSLFIGGITLLLLVTVYEENIVPIFRKFLEHAAGVIIAGGALGCVFEFFVRKEIFDIFNSSIVSMTADQRAFENAIDAKVDSFRLDLQVYASDVSSKLSLSQGSARVGLTNVHHQENNFDYSEILTESKNLIFVFNDGRTWFSQHESDLASRLSDPSKSTSVILNSRTSSFLTSLAEKVEQSPESLSAKIDESVTKIIKLSKNGHELRIYEHPLPTSYSLVMNDHSAIMIPYLMAGKSDKIPCFFFSKGSKEGFYEALRKDVVALMGERGEQTYPPQLPNLRRPSVDSIASAKRTPPSGADPR